MGPLARKQTFKLPMSLLTQFFHRFLCDDKNEHLWKVHSLVTRPGIRSSGSLIFIFSIIWTLDYPAPGVLIIEV